MNKSFSILILVLISFCGYSKTYYISPNIGNDNNSGQEDAPFRTINKAVRLLKNGDEIKLMAGNYYERIVIRKKNNIKISAYGDGRVNLFGTYKEFINNQTYPWKLLRMEKNKYWKNEQYIYVGYLPKVEGKNKPADFQDQFNYIFDKRGNQLYGYRDRADFKKRNKQNTNGEGYWFSNDSVYVAVNNPYDERYHTLYISKTGTTIKNFGSKKLVIDGGEQSLITIKYSARYAYSAEGDISDSKLLNIKFQQCNAGVHFLGVGGTGFEIENCEFYYKTDPDLIWQDIKASFLESSAIVYVRGSLKKLLIRNSHFEGVFNGVIALPGNTIISNNIFIDIGDDAVELDGDAENIQVSDNYFIDCYTAFSLCPVEKGPVYIFNNTIFSQRRNFPHQKLKDGSIRYVPPKTLKFWNLPNGKTLKDGKKQKVSGNVHFYYNTVIAKDQPFSIGGYNNKSTSPVNSTFYNNIFYSEGVLTYSTGFSEDGIDVDNNLFYSTFKNKKEPRLFIGWDGRNHSENLRNNNKWTGNIYTKIEFEQLKRINDMPETSPFDLCERDRKKLKKAFSPKKLPGHYPNAALLNKRQIPGANQ